MNIIHVVTINKGRTRQLHTHHPQLVTDTAHYLNTMLQARHGLLITIVRYWTPYTLPNDSPLTISFGLSKYVSSNTLTGLLLLHALAFVTDYGSFQTRSPILQHTFKLDRSPGKCGLPAGTKFDITAFRQEYNQRLATNCTNNPQASAFCSPSNLTTSSCEHPRTYALYHTNIHKAMGHTTLRHHDLTPTQPP